MNTIPRTAFAQFDPTPGRALYSPRETKAILGISHATCYRLIGTGDLDARKLGSKTVITRESIERLLVDLPKAGRRKALITPEAA
jgi:hypothetical protein